MLGGEGKMGFNEWLYDKRVVERNIKKGLLTKEDYKRYIESLPDLSQYIDVIKIGEDKEEEELNKKEGRDKDVRER